MANLYADPAKEAYDLEAIEQISLYRQGRCEGIENRWEEEGAKGGKHGKGKGERKGSGRGRNVGAAADTPSASLTLSTGMANIMPPPEWKTEERRPGCTTTMGSSYWLARCGGGGGVLYSTSIAEYIGFGTRGTTKFSGADAEYLYERTRRGIGQHNQVTAVDAGAQRDTSRYTHTGHDSGGIGRDDNSGSPSRSMGDKQEDKAAAVLNEGNQACAHCTFTTTLVPTEGKATRSHRGLGTRATVGLGTA